LYRVLTSDGTEHGANAQSGLTYDGQSLSIKSTTPNTPYEIVSAITYDNLVVTSGSRTPVLVYPKSGFTRMSYDYVLVRKSPATPPLVMLASGALGTDGSNVYAAGIYGFTTGSGSSLSASATTASYPDVVITLNGLRAETYSLKLSFKIMR
jgi:hypothetical protein